MSVYLLVLFFTVKDGVMQQVYGPYASIPNCEWELSRVAKELDRKKLAVQYGLSCVELVAANRVKT